MVGDYHILGKLGGGAMAELFFAQKVSRFGFIRKAVVKRVRRSRPDYLQLQEMLLDEARATACFDHPNLVSLFDVGESDQGVYLALEYVEGSDLRKVNATLRERKEALPFELAAFITVEVLRGLHHAHTSKDEHGQLLEIVHRDVNPSNVLIARSGHIKLADFGVVRMRERLQQKTEPGLVKGKYAYLAPEYIAGESCSIQTDIYAAGIMLFELLSGRECFSGKTAYEVMWKIVNKGVPMYRLEREGVPEDLQRIVHRATTMAPERRYATAQDMANALEAWLMRSGRHATPWVLSVFFTRHNLLPEETSASHMAPLANLGDVLETQNRRRPSVPPTGQPRAVEPVYTPLPGNSPKAFGANGYPTPRMPSSPQPIDRAQSNHPQTPKNSVPTGHPTVGGITFDPPQTLKPPSVPPLGDNFRPGSYPNAQPPSEEVTLLSQGDSPSGESATDDLTFTDNAPPRFPPFNSQENADTDKTSTAFESPPVPADQTRPELPPLPSPSFGTPALSTFPEPKTTDAFNANSPEGNNAATSELTEPSPAESEHGSDHPNKTYPDKHSRVADSLDEFLLVKAPLSPETPPSSGKMEETPSVDILECLYLGQHSGMVEFRCGLIWKRVNIFDGQPIGVTSNMGMELIGEHLVKSKIITREQLHQALHTSEREEQPLTRVLIQNGVLQRDVLEEELGKNLAARLNEVLDWRWGTFEFKHETLGPVDFMPRLDMEELFHKARQKLNESSSAPEIEYEEPFDPQKNLEKAVDMARSIESSTGRGKIERPWRPEES